MREIAIVNSAKDRIPQGRFLLYDNDAEPPGWFLTQASATSTDALATRRSGNKHGLATRTVSSCGHGCCGHSHGLTLSSCGHGCSGHSHGLVTRTLSSCGGHGCAGHSHGLVTRTLSSCGHGCSGHSHALETRANTRHPAVFASIDPHETPPACKNTAFHATHTKHCKYRGQTTRETSERVGGKNTEPPPHFPVFSACDTHETL